MRSRTASTTRPTTAWQTHFEYGARIGHARVLRRFIEARLPLTLNICGRALQCTPWVAEVAREHGFELCGHGWRWESPVHMSEDEERTVIAKTAAVIEALAGRRPAGWHSKSSRSVHSRRLLREQGFLYDSDDYGDEQPYLLDLGGAVPHVVLPYGFDTNDMRFFSGSFVRATDFSGYVIDAVDALLAERDAGTEDAHDRAAFTHHRPAGPDCGAGPGAGPCSGAGSRRLCDDARGHRPPLAGSCGAAGTADAPAAIAAGAALKLRTAPRDTETQN